MIFDAAFAAAALMLMPTFFAPLCALLPDDAAMLLRAALQAEAPRC